MRENNPYKKYMESENKTRGQAIKAFCSHCCGCTEEEVNPGFRTDIRNCTAVRCPLYPFRPYQGKDDADKPEL